MVRNTQQVLSALALAGTAAAFLGVAAIGPWFARESTQCPVETGQPFPEMAFSTANGGVVTTRALAGRTAVLLFTTPECPACRIDTPGWRELAGSGRDAVTLWQVWVGRSAERPLAAQPHDVPDDVLLDDRAGFARTLKASRVPLTILLDAQQVVRGCFVGAQPEAAKRAALDELRSQDTGSR